MDEQVDRLEIRVELDEQWEMGVVEGATKVALEASQMEPSAWRGTIDEVDVEESRTGC